MKYNKSLAALSFFMVACSNETAFYCGETTVSTGCPTGCDANRIYRVDSAGQCHPGDNDGNLYLCWRRQSQASTQVSFLCKTNAIGEVEVAMFGALVDDDNGASGWNTCTQTEGEVYSQARACQ